MGATHTTRGGGEGHAPLVWTDESREAALVQLERILASPHFRASKRCSTFLRYVVEHASANDFERLKERTLGVAVFERPPDYDTNQDPVVRLAAGEVRKRLAQYYQEEGKAEDPRIALLPGSYVPALQVMHAELAPTNRAPQVRVIEPPSIGEERKPLDAPATVAISRKYWAWTAVAGLAITAAATWTRVAPSRETALDRFWKPVLASEGPVLVCIGQPKVYFFRTETQAELDKWFSGSTAGKLPPRVIQSVPLSEVYPAWSRHISLSDATAFARLSNFFGRTGKSVTLRGGRSVSLTDLRGRPAVLIGAFNNDWTLSLTGELRYYFDVEGPGGRQLVRDRERPSNAEWAVRHWWPDRNIDLDYAIVSRVKNPTTERMVVTAAGVTSAGTEAAGEFLSNPAYFTEALRNAPSDWSNKNIQVVLSVQVLSGAAGPPKVIAVHLW